MTYVIIGIVVLLVIFVLVQYNGFVKTNNLVKEAFSTMDVYLKKRWDLIPNLVEVVKGYATHESQTLEEITSLRAGSYDNMSQNNKIEVNEKLTAGLSKIMAVVENYPELKANQNFMDLSNNLVKVEDEIANSRKYYNGCVRLLNNKVEMFPSNIIAGLFRFESAKMFEADLDARSNVKVNL